MARCARFWVCVRCQSTQITFYDVSGDFMRIEIGPENRKTCAFAWFFSVVVSKCTSTPKRNNPIMSITYFLIHCSIYNGHRSVCAHELTYKPVQGCYTCQTFFSRIEIGAAQMKEKHRAKNKWLEYIFTWFHRLFAFYEYESAKRRSAWHVSNSY